ncbi:MAG: hypothetical protein AB7L09_02730 [Nitrospira sp.]
MSSTTSIPTEIAKRCSAAKLKVGDVYSRHSFGKVVHIDRMTGFASIQNTNGDKWDVGLGVIELEFTIAEQYDGEEMVSRTALIELLKTYPRTAMTVNYNKKVVPNDNADQILDLINEAIKTGKAPTKAVVRKLANEQQVGPERTIIGFHTNGFDDHGRLKFQESGTGQRLVDPRTINWMVLNRVKYIVK